MPINKKRVNASTSTHDGNGGKVDFPKSESTLKNNMLPTEMLIDPEDLTAGDTHTSIEASRKPAKKAKAAAETTNISTMDFDVDPAKGYIENAEFEEEEEEIEEAGLQPELTNSMKPQKPLTTADADVSDAFATEDDWDAEPPETPEDTLEDDIEESEGAIEGNLDDIVDDQPDDIPSNDSDSMTLMDVDDIAEDDTADIAFACCASRLMVIKGHRIIATMTEKAAKRNGRHDMYMSDQFTQVCAHELQKQGLRKGLKALGFVAATVNVSKSEVVNARVKKAVTKTEAAVRKVAADKEAAFQQSLAIASVGLNRNYFAKYNNELKSTLLASLQAAGVRTPLRILNKAFASAGPAYARNVVELAHKLAAMPQSARDGYVDALDMTSDDLDTVEDDSVPIGADFDEENEFDDVEDSPSTFATAGVVTASNRSNNKKQRVVSTYSARANDILNGDAPLFQPF